MKTAIVTGSTKGIGKAIAIKLLAEGYYVIFNYAKDENSAEILEREISELYSDRYAIIRCDLSEIKNVLSFYESCLNCAKADTIDELVINAGTTSYTDFDKCTEDDYMRVMNTNINVPFFLVQAFKPSITKGGNVILIGSVLGQYPHSVSIPYGISKAALEFFAKCLVKEFAENDISVNAICPGFVDTPWQEKKDEQRRASINAKVAKGRFAEPEEIAEFAYSVIQNKYINGSILNIDGGYNYR
jgi:3-oxoacyl-[acyl-carrier protein] reductase